jgi:hypothetical protein
VGTGAQLVAEGTDILCIQYSIKINMSDIPAA